MPQSGVTCTLKKLFPLRVVFAAVWLMLVVAIAIFGGILNRARGGMHPFTQYGYWSAHIRSRLLMAGPTAALVIVMSLHVRASLVIFIMTWFSLYAGWGTYFNIGNSPTSYLSRTGIFDWALGRSEVNWTYHHNFMREYTGMSLRGLLWTGPAGYALNMMDFGWHYSLTGSWMGLVYYLGGKTPDWNKHYAKQNLNGQIQWSEFYWGWWIWFILELVCLCYVIQATRKRLGVNSQHSILHVLWSGCYEAVMFTINVIFMCSVGYYQLVQQEDIKNKGQTFFGLYTGVLFLTIVQAFNWGLCWRRLNDKRHNSLVRSNSNIAIAASSDTNVSCETTPLLPWPQSHPNACVLPRQLVGSNVSNGVINNSLSYQVNERRQYGCSDIWNSLEAVVHLNTFIFLRWFLGAISALHTILVLIMFTMCVVMDISAPRFIPQPIHNATV